MIPINDLQRHTAALEPGLSENVSRVLRSGRFLMGNEVEQFEREFAEYCGVGYAVGVANGTDAIEIGLRAIGVGPGSRVATVANAAYYSSAALAAIGAEPVYVDVDPDTHLMDLELLGRALAAEALDAVIVTHLYGLLHDMAAVLALAAAAEVPVFEDCAQAHGARRDGRKAGSFGAAAGFSFFPTKNLGGLGDGGAVVCNDAAVAGSARRLRQYGWDQKYRVGVSGGRNSRLDEIQAAALRCKLSFLDGWNARRRAIAGRYSTRLAHHAIAVPPVRGEESVAHLYVVRCERRDDLAAPLRAAGIMTEVHYPVPDHLQAPRQGRSSSSLAVTERLAGEVLSLPCFPELADAEVERVIEVVNAW